MINTLNKVADLVIRSSIYSKERSIQFGEVFTPTLLINEMLDALPSNTWEDSSKTFLDPCAGKGNYVIEVIQRLYQGLEKQIPNPIARLQHIVENQIYIAEYQKDSAELIDLLFTFGKDFKVNLYVGDTLEMPEDFFDLSWEERREKYPENCIID